MFWIKKSLQIINFLKVLWELKLFIYLFFNIINFALIIFPRVATLINFFKKKEKKKQFYALQCFSENFLTGSLYSLIKYYWKLEQINKILI